MTYRSVDEIGDILKFICPRFDKKHVISKIGSEGSVVYWSGDGLFYRASLLYYIVDGIFLLKIGASNVPGKYYSFVEVDDLERIHILFNQIQGNGFLDEIEPTNFTESFTLGVGSKQEGKELFGSLSLYPKRRIIQNDKGSLLLIESSLLGIGEYNNIKYRIKVPGSRAFAEFIIRYKDQSLGKDNSEADIDDIQWHADDNW